MSSTATPGVPATEQPTLEQKILLAVQEAEQVAQIFSPTVAEAMQAGVTIEPLISAGIHYLAQLFAHHTKQAATS